MIKLPSIQARDLMKPNFPWIKHYYRESLPKGTKVNPKETICIISEWLNEPTYYANSLFKGWTIGVEVHVFYALNSSEAFIDEEIRIAQLFVKNGWTVENSRNRSKDPDTGQVDKVFYFAKDLMIKKERER